MTTDARPLLPQQEGREIDCALTILQEPDDSDDAIPATGMGGPPEDPGPSSAA